MNEELRHDVNVYLVDDDELHLKILKNKFYSSTGYRLVTFTSGEDFLEYILKKPINTRHYHIAILDYQMHSNNNNEAKNGIEILQLLKDIHPEFEVIMLSGANDEDLAGKAIRLGATEFVKKNENSFTRILNAISWIISNSDLKRKKFEYKIATSVFLGLLATLSVSLAVLYFIFPEWFKI
ncbi:MAG: response regulator [Bacteroidales bacterium]|nr:response regulator [Bacteroidales bacterium]